MNKSVRAWGRMHRHHARVIAWAAGALLGAPGLVFAQSSDGDAARPRGRRAVVTPVDLSSVTVRPALLRSTDGAHEGALAPALPAPDGVCPEKIVTLTDANFSGGSFVVQAGFAESEIAAASYLIPAADFPLRIDRTEMIFATSAATVQTTTQWSVFIWQRTPDVGTLVRREMSDGVVLPHIVLPPGTNGVNVQFSVDPGSPEQIVVLDDGSHTFSVGYGIDRHNNQTQNPCFVAPPTCCNAFPVTDVSGLQNPTNNWLYGVNCGPLGCPANGGWTRFSTLPGFCRPSGDWVIRVTYTPLDCPGGGACCLSDGTCLDNVEGSQCVAQGGVFQGIGTICAQVNCPQPTGACCFQPSGCLNLTPTDCNTAGGFWQGAGTTCATIVCFATGACCLPNGSCLGNVSQADCTAQGGTYQGNNSQCAIVNCPQPTGACCLSNGGCLVLTAADCSQIPNSTWAGPLTTCVDGNANGRADACECIGIRPGDFVSDGIINGLDMPGFVSQFLNPGPVGSPDFCRANFVRSNPEVLDAADLLAFVNCLADPTACP